MSIRINISGADPGDPLDVSTIDITPELAEAMRRIGQDPADFYIMRWPTGASRVGRIRVLLYEDELAQILSTHEPFDVYTLDILFSRMSAESPVPMLLATDGKPVYAVDFVDPRDDLNSGPGTFAGWLVDDPGDHQVGAGANVSTDDKEKLYRSTMTGPIIPVGEPWTPQTLIESIIAAYFATEWDVPNVPEFQDEEDVRDIVYSGQTRGELIDQIAQAAGFVLVAYPSIGYDGTAFRYRFVPIVDGEQTAGEELVRLQDDLVHGGLRPRTVEAPDPPTPLLTGAHPPESYMANVPNSITVYFPRAVKKGEGDYRFNDDTDWQDPAAHYTSDRYAVLDGYTTGRPETAGTTPALNIYDHKWALVDDQSVIQNLADLEARAEIVTARYYARFYAATGNVLFRGFADVRPWSGAGMIEWDDAPTGPTTRVRGEVNDPLFGFSMSELKPGNVRSTGLIRMFPRSDGGVLFDAPVVNSSGLYYGKITAVAGSAQFPIYDAEAYSDPSVAVTGATPLRAHDVTDPAIPLQVNPKIVDDPCILGVRDDGTIDLWLLETAKLAACATAQASAFVQDDALAKLRAMATSRR